MRSSTHWCLERVSWIKSFRGHRFYSLTDLSFFKHMCFLGPVIVYLFPVSWDSAEKYEGTWDSELTPGTERACSVSTVFQVAISDAPLTRGTWYRIIPSRMCRFNKAGWICRPQLPTMPRMPLVQVCFKASWVRSMTCKHPDSSWTYDNSTAQTLVSEEERKLFFISYVNWISWVMVCGKHSVLSVRLCFWKCLLLNLMFYIKNTWILVLFFLN